MTNVNTMTDKAVEAVYLFIAELLGYKRGTKHGKIAYGKNAHKHCEVPEAEGGDLHEHIWLTRLYEELDRLVWYKFINDGSYDGFHWSVPIELDASASMLGITGALLGDKRLLEMTNMSGDDTTDGGILQDPWYVDGLSRLHVKKVATPRLYGSNQPVHALWTSNKLAYNMDMITLMNKEFSGGAIGLADSFKDFVVHNCVPTAEMNIQIWDEKFTIKCNNYKRVGDVAVSFELFDTQTGTIRKVTHMKTKMVPDLESFRTYFQTLLIHNLDSQAANYVSGLCFDKYGFVLDVHDAYIVSPCAAEDVRAWYCEFMESIYANRARILNDYFKSIGVTSVSNDNWLAVMSKVEKVDSFKCRGMTLK
jgi:hypothetical protein